MNKQTPNLALLCSIILIITSTIGHAQDTTEPTRSVETMHNHMQLSAFAAGHHVENDANGEKFTFPYYGLVVGLPSLGDLICGVRIFASDYVSKFSSSGNSYHHYFTGFGVQMRYPFWNFLYADMNVDYIVYNLSNQWIKETSIIAPAKSGGGLIVSPGLGVHILLGDWFYAYAGKYLTYGQTGTMKSAGEDRVPDETFSFEWQDDYQYGLGIFF